MTNFEATEDATVHAQRLCSGCAGGFLFVATLRPASFLWGKSPRTGGHFIDAASAVSDVNAEVRITAFRGALRPIDKPRSVDIDAVDNATVRR